MNNDGVKAIIFDLGNVLIDFDHRRAAEKIRPFTDKTAEEVFNLFFDSEVTQLFEQGKISPQGFFLKVKEMLNLKLDYLEFVPIWNGIFFLSEKNRAVYSLAKSLKRHYGLALLSNINILHWEYLKQRFPVFAAFHNVFTSYELGLSKPSALIYKKTLQILQVLPGEVFYTDDRPECVQRAKELGICATVFRDAEQLKKDLVNSGINIDYILKDNP